MSLTRNSWLVEVEVRIITIICTKYEMRNQYTRPVSRISSNVEVLCSARTSGHKHPFGKLGGSVSQWTSLVTGCNFNENIYTGAFESGIDEINTWK